MSNIWSATTLSLDITTRKGSEMRRNSVVTQEESRPESIATQEFANSVLSTAAPGFHSDSETPAMATPATPTAAQFVIQGSTICLVC
ncbi:cypemycin family RiPP [Streptomyces sp. DSM 42041]|uniref:Cypemycin family RiPP n=1 Tax=Streptomyces hazeniae TaxID=3075538 RepID=A0ABU2NS05_9ACTN|nr:cypemycin family RiPP [Streptomyces sp. DSM 42041]MDT0379534.1 cypemycin family RiPP [Streptomyces sp. DSM 42041]